MKKAPQRKEAKHESIADFERSSFPWMLSNKKAPPTPPECSGGEAGVDEFPIDEFEISVLLLCNWTLGFTEGAFEIAMLFSL